MEVLDTQVLVSVTIYKCFYWIFCYCLISKQIGCSKSYTRHVFCHLNFFCYITCIFPDENCCKSYLMFLWTFCTFRCRILFRGVNFIQNFMNKILSFWFDVVCQNKIGIYVWKIWDRKFFVHFIWMFCFAYKGILVAVDNT